jgi:hypothetical protein
MWRHVGILLTDVPPKRRLTKYLHGATSQKTVFFIVIAVKTSDICKIFTIVYAELMKLNEGKESGFRTGFQAV